VRVAFVVSLRRGGPVEQALLLAGQLVATGTQVEVVCGHRAVAARFAEAGCEATVLPLRSWVDVRNGVRVWRRTRGADVVHAHDRQAGLWVRLGPRPSAQGIRVYTVHGLPEPYLPPPVGDERPGVRAVLAYRGLDAVLCRRADAVIVPSEAVARTLRDRLGYPARRLSVVPNGVVVPEDPMPPGRDVGTIALLDPVKGVDVFLRAAAEVAAERSDVSFRIYGTGPEEQSLHDLGRRLGVAERVTLEGYVEAASALARLRLFVSSSYMENAPLALLQAMASGVPAVATRVGGVPEIATDGAVELVDAGDAAALAAAMRGLLDDPERARRQAAAARARVLERYTALDNAEAIRALYADCLSRRAQRR
jgi:glycosyltransferase involved in cell wall biosynthesis